MSNNPMLTMREDFEQIPVAMLEKFEGLPLDWICDANGRTGALGGGILPICNNRPFVGLAFTFSCAAVDNLGLHVALKFVRPGDVLVAKGQEFGECAVTGDLMMGLSQNSGVRAFVTDTHIRDRDGLQKLDMAFFARGFNPNGPYKNGPGTIGLPIAIGGHIVDPGDLIIGDTDSVAVVEGTVIDAVLKAFEGVGDRERAVDARVASGQTYMELAYDALEKREVKWV